MVILGRVNLNTAGARGEQKVWRVKVTVCCGRLFLCFGKSFHGICIVEYEKNSGFHFCWCIILHAA